jgi:CheY-like chemotaxis protein
MPANVCEHEASPGGVESILIVEDQDAVRNVVALMLESNGYVVHAAAHPADALRLVEQEGPTIDLLLTDLVMPDVSGREPAARIRQHRPGTRVLSCPATRTMRLPKTAHGKTGRRTSRNRSRRSSSRARSALHSTIRLR